MWPTAPTAFSQPQLIVAVHCGEQISMKDCGLWATTTCELSRQSSEGGEEENVGVSLADSVSLEKCLCVCIQYMLRLAKWNIRLTAIIRVYHCSASFSSPLCSLRCALLPGLSPLMWSTAESCGVLLLTNQTSQCHWAALSKTHGHVSSPHSPAFQRSTGSRAKEL